jgi:hypothetical protein
MFRYPPTDEHEYKEMMKVNPEPWMVDLLSLNPKYCGWGPYEDYMAGDKGWSAAMYFDGWDEFNVKELDERNEIINFYFEIDRDRRECEVCNHSGFRSGHSSGYNQETYYLNEDFYNHWQHDLTEDELEVLKIKKRVPRDITLEEINQPDYIHDDINRVILVKTRAQRLGVWGLCTACEGKQYQFITDEAHVNLILWLIHPRKGASRGIEIKHITIKDLPEVKAYLTKAAIRNACRFSEIMFIGY